MTLAFRIVKFLDLEMYIEDGKEKKNRRKTSTNNNLFLVSDREIAQLTRPRK